MHKSLRLIAIIAPVAWYVACTASNQSTFGDDTSTSSSTTTSTSGTGGGSSSGDGGFDPGDAGSSSGDPGCNHHDSNEDFDGDGFYPPDDCNDCDANVNPNAVEVPTPTDGAGGSVPVDENCNDEIDEDQPICDQGLSVSDGDPMNAARAIDLCQTGGSGQWGVVSASYVRANGTTYTSTLNNGLLSTFGSNIVPQHGSSMLVLSSGNARAQSDSSACNSTSCSNIGAGTPPSGFPQDVVGCSGGTNINDDIGLELTIQAPSNALGYSFDFAFMSFEYPEWVCTTYNDQFIALVNPAPQDAINGNISFDSQTNPVSVNIALFDHCNPAFVSYYASHCYTGCPSVPSPYCPNGDSFMNGTGFNEWDTSTGSGSTGWLVTMAPVDPNQLFSIRFAIWDTGDTALDSTVVIDNFKWSAEPGISVGTEPIPDPR